MTDPIADTLAWYDRQAVDFAARTADLDLAPLYGRFLRHVRPGGRILDAGCGVGRDTLAFADRGFEVVAFDASEEMARLARERVGGRAEVLRMRFEDVAWQEEFDGIWACASLLHVSAAGFPGVAARLAVALRHGGAWYMSFKHGTSERIDGGRRFTDHTEASLGEALLGNGLEPAEAWVTDDVRVGHGRRHERWLNAIVVRGLSPFDQR